MDRFLKRTLTLEGEDLASRNLPASMGSALSGVLHLHSQVTYPDPIRFGQTLSVCSYCSELDPDGDVAWPCETMEPLEEFLDHIPS